MIINVVVNVYDIHRLVEQHLKAKFGPDVELGGLIVKSWNTTILDITDGTMDIPIRHHLRPEHSQLFKD